MVSLIGPSGCGKSTLLNIGSGLTAPSEGMAFVDGERVEGPNAHVAFMLQKDLLLPWRTVAENVMFGVEIQGVAPAERRRRAQALLENLKLAEFSEHYPHQLSGGMRQRVALARTLAVDPTVLLLDEPFSAVDAQTRMVLQRELAQTLKRAGKTALLITHDLLEAVTLSDRVLVMSRRPGRIIDEIAIDIPDRDDPLKRRTASEGRRLRQPADGPPRHRRAGRRGAGMSEAANSSRGVEGHGGERRAADRVPRGVAMGAGAAAHSAVHHPAAVDGRRRSGADVARVGRLRSTPASPRRRCWRASCSAACSAPVIGYLLGMSPTAEFALSPYILALQIAPKVAFAPLFILWMGFTVYPKILVAILIVFFPVMVNVLTAIRTVDPDLINLARAFKATRAQIFWKIEFPASMPPLFAGLAHRLDARRGRRRGRRTGRRQYGARLSAVVRRGPGQHRDGVRRDRDAHAGRRHRLSRW